MVARDARRAIVSPRRDCFPATSCRIRRSKADANSDGAPDFWHKGGNITAIDVWTSALFVSSFACLQLNDTSATGYGEWFSTW